MTTTHFVPYDADHIALCGERCRDDEHATAPTCEECQEILDQGLWDLAQFHVDPTIEMEESDVKFEIVFKQGITVVAKVEGREVSPHTMADTNALAGNIVRTEQFLERVTGLRVHINQING